MVDIIGGIFGLLYIIISMIVGFSIIAKYLQSKNIDLLYVGITYIFMCSPWWGITSFFIAALFNGGVGLPLEAILLLSFVPLPLAVIFWMLAFSNILYNEKRKVILLGIMCFSLFYWVYFLSFYFIGGPTTLAVLESPVDTRSTNIIFVLCLFTFIFILLISGVMFARKTMKLDDPDMKTKGKLLLIAFPAFCIGALLDAAVTITPITLIIFRTLLIISAIFFYGGFILPNLMKKLFQK